MKHLESEDFTSSYSSSLKNEPQSSLQKKRDTIYSGLADDQLLKRDQTIKKLLQEAEDFCLSEYARRENPFAFFAPGMLKSLNNSVNAEEDHIFDIAEAQIVSPASIIEVPGPT